MARFAAVLVAIAAGLALADSSIVALALPPILRDLDTTVEGVAAVIGVYTLVLAAGILPAAALARRIGPAHTGAIGLLVLAGASLGCAAADSLGMLLTFRALQAAGGAAGLLAAFDLIGAGGEQGTHGRRLWVAAAVFGTAAGPAIGGALTEALDWRAIFVAQAPVAAAAAAACWTLHVPQPGLKASGPLRAWPTIALALLSAALTAVLFLLVLELVAGWSIAPLRAAAAVTVLPAAALLSSRLQRPDPAARAALGCVLVAAGTAALAFLPDASVWWTVAPQAVAGAGMGLALPALAGGLLPERTAGDAARLLVARHVGIVVALLILAPVVTGRLDHATEQARLKGAALVLDARLKPQDKIALAPTLLHGVDSQDPRAGLASAIAQQRGNFEGTDRVTFDALARRSDETLIDAVGDAFRAALLITAALALLAAAALLGSRVTRRVVYTAVAGLAGAGAIAAQAAVYHSRRPDPVVLRDPCAGRDLPDTGGLTGLLQDASLKLLDRGACNLGSSREELVLALADDAEAQRFKRRHGVDPRSVGGILGGLLG